LTTLLIDSYNLIHRSRFDWGGGLATAKNQVIYNFLKGIKPIVERFSPKEVYFILDGAPKSRLEAFPEYKANRKLDNLSEEEVAYWESFHDQKRQIINIVRNHFPFTMVSHPDFECDDILNYLATKLDGEKVIISSDTDFIQTLDLSEDTKLWNPVSQSYRERMDVDYAKYKAMLGDKTDNIPGVKGIGKVGAVKLLKDSASFDQKMRDNSFRAQFEKSYFLVKFAEMEGFSQEIIYSKGAFSRDEFQKYLRDFGFNSMITEPYLSNYCSALESIT
jgi:DNA polymerase-1